VWVWTRSSVLTFLSGYVFWNTFGWKLQQYPCPCGFYSWRWKIPTGTCWDRTGHRHLVRGKVLVESIHPDCGEVSERNPLIIFFRFLHFLYPSAPNLWEFDRLILGVWRARFEDSQQLLFGMKASLLIDIAFILITFIYICAVMHLIWWDIFIYPLISMSLKPGFIFIAE